MSERAVLVTGGSVRLGREIVEALADRGYEVAIHYNTSEREALELAGSLGSRGVRALAYKADLTRRESASRLMREVVEDFPEISVLVNSASMFDRGDIASLSLDEMERHFALHLYSPLILTREMVENTSAGSGSIVNILDTRIQSDRPNRCAYSLSKKALAEFTKSAALEFAPKFTVNGIAPGIIDEFQGEEEAGYGDSNPMKRPVSLRAVINTLLFFLENRDITGNIVYPDCGSSLCQ